MNIKSTYLVIAISLFVIINCASCKKYEENALWFKRPEKAFKGGLLNVYNVDGVDSLPMWDNIYSIPPDYNGMGYKFDIRKAYFSYNYKEDQYGFDSNLGIGVLKFINKKKDVEITFVMTSPVGVADAKYNVFLTKISTWKILKLTKSGSLKIERVYNNKTYQIQIN